MKHTLEHVLNSRSVGNVTAFCLNAISTRHGTWGTGSVWHVFCQLLNTHKTLLQKRILNSCQPSAGLKYLCFDALCFEQGKLMTFFGTSAELLLHCSGRCQKWCHFLYINLMELLRWFQAPISCCLARSDAKLKPGSVWLPQQQFSLSLRIKTPNNEANMCQWFIGLHWTRSQDKLTWCMKYWNTKNSRNSSEWFDFRLACFKRCR